VAVVLLSSGDLAPLEVAVKTLSPACVRFGARLLVIWPALEPARTVLDRYGSKLEVLDVRPELALSERRSWALARCEEDIVVFVDETPVAEETWAEVLSARMGLVRWADAVGGSQDWRQVLDALGLPGGK
jgi:hypothetical protein